MKLRIQDILLTLMFGALVFLAHDNWERVFLVALAVLQLIEGRIPLLDTVTGRTASVVLQLVLCFLFIGYTHGLESGYYLVLLLPVVSTASYMGVTGTVAISIAAIGTYTSFLLFINWKIYDFADEAMHVLVI